MLPDDDPNEVWKCNDCGAIVEKLGERWVRNGAPHAIPGTVPPLTCAGRNWRKIPRPVEPEHITKLPGNATQLRAA